VKRIAIIVVICGLAAAGAFAGYKIHVSKTFAADESSTMFTALPVSAPVVVYVDAKTFRESSLYKKMIQENPPPAPSGDYADFMKNTGFDFSRDLDRVAFAIESAQHGSKMTAVAEGHFDQAKIAAYATLKGKSTVRDGKTYFEFDEPKDNRTVEMTFLSTNRVRISSVEISATANKKDDKPAPSEATSEDYATRISRVAGSPLFAIADVRSWSGQVNLGNYTDLIRSIKRYTLTANPNGDTLHIALEAECATAEDAQQLSSTANAMKMLAPSLLNGAMKNSAGSNNAASANQFMNSIQITADGTRVKLAFAVTSDMLSQASHMGTAKPAAQPDH
jgi:hypothetical protein